MAIYHCSVQVISRGKGRSCVAAAAYRSGSQLADVRQGFTYDYRRRGDVRETWIQGPSQAPEWMTDRQMLWTAVDGAEKRKDAQTAREVNVALPRELTPEQQHAVVHAFVHSAFVERGMVADVAIHERHHDQEPNPHAHILLTTRTLTSEGFGPKNRDWNAKDVLIAWRNQWEFECNEALAEAGHTVQIDARTLTDQGIDRLPTVHEGVAVRQMEQRGIETERGNWNRAIREHQTAVVDLQTVRDERKKLEQVQQRIGREEAWRKTAGWSVAQREWLRKQEEQAGRVWTRQDIQHRQRQSQASREQHQAVWQEAQRRVQDAHQALSDAKQHQHHLAWQVAQGRQAQAVIHREFSGVRGVWARWRGKAEYQAQQTQVETGREAARQQATVQLEISQREAQGTQAQEHWEQRQKERQEFLAWDRWFGTLVQCAWTPEELQGQRQQAQEEARRVAQSARSQADQEYER